MNDSMHVLAFRGINYSCLGHYLMGLGLLGAASHKWFDARGCWHDGLFHLAGPFTEVDVSNFILQDWEPTPYEKWWESAQRADRGKNAVQTWQARSMEPMQRVRVGDCTLFPISRNCFNPLFGTGGNIGKRELATAWKEAAALRSEVESQQWLDAALFGRETTSSPPFTNAGTWFGYDNKTFNSGLGWYRNGMLSPWSFLLAMEGALLIRGGSGRRLGSRARPYAVFPFVSQPLPPSGAEQVGQKAAGEFWAPLWEQPAALSELRSLFQRGLARVGERAAAAPHEFAVAALAAGTDAGVTHFVRFELRQTTSSQVYEALPRQTLTVAKESNAPNGTSSSILLSEFLGRSWFDRLPYEPVRRDSRSRFFGLRGPLERLILTVAEEPENPQRWRELLLHLAEVQARIDRNLKLRKSCNALPWLSSSWLPRIFSGTPPLDVRLAIALASLGTSTEQPALCNVFGVSVLKSRRIVFPEVRPAGAVWHGGDAQEAILDLVQRRLIDSKTGDLTLLEPGVRVTSADVTAFLCADAAMLEGVQSWLPAMALLDWAYTGRPWPLERRSKSAEPSLLLWSFFKPFFTADNIELGERKFFRNGTALKASFSRQIFNLLRSGATSEATSMARASYQAQGLQTIQPVVPVGFDHERLAAALALSTSDTDLAQLVNRWLGASNSKTGERR